MVKRAKHMLKKVGMTVVSVFLAAVLFFGGVVSPVSASAESHRGSGQAGQSTTSKQS